MTEFAKKCRKTALFRKMCEARYFLLDKGLKKGLFESGLTFLGGLILSLLWGPELGHFGHFSGS